MASDVERVAREVSDFVNHMGARGEAEALAEALACDHRTLVQIKADVFIRFLRILAENYENGFFDARNEEACKRASIMVKALNEAGYDYNGMPFI
jgi:hypothetical protein